MWKLIYIIVNFRSDQIKIFVIKSNLIKNMNKNFEIYKRNNKINKNDIKKIKFEIKLQKVNIQYWAKNTIFVVVNFQIYHSIKGLKKIENFYQSLNIFLERRKLLVSKKFFFVNSSELFC